MRLYDALSRVPEREAGNEVHLVIYRSPGRPDYGRFRYAAPADGLVQVDPPHGSETRLTGEFEIAWTKWGDAGPLVLFLHRVPANRAQWSRCKSTSASSCRLPGAQRYVPLSLLDKAKTGLQSAATMTWLRSHGRGCPS
jgi:hypothetical protein